jgi:hypothetical protein
MLLCFFDLYLPLLFVSDKYSSLIGEYCLSENMTLLMELPRIFRGAKVNSYVEVIVLL